MLIEGLRKRPLRRVNGSFGRIVPHVEKAVDVGECVVQLMDGVVITVAVANVSVLDLGPGGGGLGVAVRGPQRGRQDA